MTKGEPFLHAKEVLVCTIIVTCMSFIWILFFLAGAISYGSPFLAAWSFVVNLVVPIGLWWEYARRRNKPS